LPPFSGNLNEDNSTEEQNLDNTTVPIEIEPLGVHQNLPLEEATQDLAHNEPKKKSEKP